MKGEFQKGWHVSQRQEFFSQSVGDSSFVNAKEAPATQTRIEVVRVDLDSEGCSMGRHAARGLVSRK